MRKKMPVTVLIIALIVCFVLTWSIFGAKSIKEKKEELKKVQNQKDDVSKDLNDMKNKIVKQTNELSDMKKSIKGKTKLIEKSQQDLDQTKDDIKKRRTDCAADRHWAGTSRPPPRS